jgi:hypothetical protein
VGFFALSGRLPFDGPDAMTVLTRHVTDPAPPVASFVPGVPDRLADVIDRCLSKDPAARYPSGEAFAVAVATALDRRTAVAVRAFVTEARQLSTATLLYGAFASVAFPLLVLQFLQVRETELRAAAIAVAVAMVVAPLAVMLARVRRLVRAGFGHRDLTDALRAELFHRREELAFLYGEGPSRLERVSRRVCYLALAIAAGVVAAAERTPALTARALVPLVWAAATVLALLAAVVARSRTEHRTDPKAERRLRFWSGPPGRWLFALARVRGPVTPAPGARGA